jgi:hypothetical protein
MNEFQELLDKFNTLPKVETTPPTFMEIAGYPHYENVCSNILAFFFDTEEQHEYKDLFLNSLLKCVDEELLSKDITTLNVIREMPTDKGNRIDLIIDTEEVVIGIENKIWAGLYNDLEDYSNFLINKFKKETVKIVLSLKKVPEFQLSAGFVNVTYSEFFENVKQDLGNQLISKNNRYLFQLIDFIETMQNHTKNRMMNEKTLKFFIEEKEQIDNFLNEHEKVKNYIYSKLIAVRNILNQRIEEEKIELVDNKQWVWKKFDLVHDFSFEDGLVISVDTTFQLEGIAIKVWVRKGSANKVRTLNELRLAKNLSQRIEDHFEIQDKQDMGLQTPSELVANTILNVLKEIDFKTNENISLN